MDVWHFLSDDKHEQYYEAYYGIENLLKVLFLKEKYEGKLVMDIETYGKEALRYENVRMLTLIEVQQK